MSELYKFIHILATESTPTVKKTGKRGSLKGIWRGSQIDESIFIDQKNLFLLMSTNNRWLCNVDLEMHDRLIVATAFYFHATLITKDDLIKETKICSTIW